MSPRALLLSLLLFCTVSASDAAAQTLQAPWVDLGNALAGAKGLPVLTATGPLTGGSVLTVELTNVVELQHAYLVVGFSMLNAPYKGGILVPNFNFLLQFSTGLTGHVKLVTHFPQDVPANFPIVLQFWINDEAAIAGRSGSNAVGALTP